MWRVWNHPVGGGRSEGITVPDYVPKNAIPVGIIQGGALEPVLVYTWWQPAVDYDAPLPR
jgi:hypothetical protein